MKKRGEMSMKNIAITDTIHYAGADDKTIDLFESQYVVPKETFSNFRI